MYKRQVLGSLADLSWVWVLHTGAVAELPQAEIPLRWLDGLPQRAAEDLQVAVSDPEQTMQMLSLIHI